MMILAASHLATAAPYPLASPAAVSGATAAIFLAQNESICQKSPIKNMDDAENGRSG